MLSKKNSIVTMVIEFLENPLISQKSVATIGFICFF